MDFKYDHDNDGVFITGTDAIHNDDVKMYFDSDDISKLFKCLMIDRVKEQWQNNKDMVEMISAIAKVKKCDKCDGFGVLIKPPKPSKGEDE